MGPFFSYSVEGQLFRKSSKQHPVRLVSNSLALFQEATKDHFDMTSLIFSTGGCTGRRAKPGRFGSLVFAMKNRHLWGECSWILAGKARKYGRFWVFACVPNPGKQRHLETVASKR